METMECIRYQSLNLQLSPPNPLFHKTSQFCRIKASSSARSPSKPPRKPTKFPRRRRRNPHSLPFFQKSPFPSSLPLHDKNPQAIYKDIQAFARQNKLKEALTILDYVDRQGIPVNTTTFSSLLAACVRSKSLTEGRQIHAHIRTNGLEKNEFLRAKLAQMYTSCGSIEEAQRVFNECTSSNSVYSWNALLRGSVVSGRKRYLDVLSAFCEMRSLAVNLNEYTFSTVLKSFAGASAFRQGLKAHALLIKYGFINSSMLRTGMIDLYFKCGKVKLAHHLFEEIPERDIVLWGTMIAGFAHNRMQREALEYVRWMISEGIYPNSVILTTILPVIGEVWARKIGQEVHAFVVKSKGYSKQLAIQSGLVGMYCKCGDMESGRRVFYCSGERNTISWTALISGYISNGRLEQALRSVAWMQQEGFKPDVVTVATVLPVCGQLRALNHGMEIHAYAVKNCFFPNVSVVTSLMIMYSKCGVLDYSLKLFNGLESRNVISWTAMIESYAESGCLREAIGVFRSMQLSKHRPDWVVMAKMLNICGALKDVKLGKEIHGQVLKKNFESIPSVSADMIKMYGSCGLISSAKLVFDAVRVKGSMTWTAIIEAHGYNDLCEDAIRLFHQMISDGFTPNHFTFKVVLLICRKAGFVDEACQIFSVMTRKYELEASEEHYCIMIELLNMYGRVEEAERFMQMKSVSS